MGCIKRAVHAGSNRSCYTALYLVILIENSERAFIFWFGSEFKVFDVLRDDLSVCDQKPLLEIRENIFHYNCTLIFKGHRTHLSINHVRDHHNLVSFCIWKFQRKFGGLDVKSQHHRVLESIKEIIIKKKRIRNQSDTELMTESIKLSYRSLHKIISSDNFWWVSTASVSNIVPVSLRDGHSWNYNSFCVYQAFQNRPKNPTHFYHMDLEVDGQSDMIGNVIFPHIHYVV